MIYINGSYYPKDRIGRIREAKRNFRDREVYGCDVYDRDDNFIGFSVDSELWSKVDHEIIPNPAYFRIWCWSVNGDSAEYEIFFYEIPVIGWEVSEGASVPIGIDEPFAGLGHGSSQDYLIEDTRSGVCWLPYDRSFDNISNAKKLIFEQEKASHERKKQAVSA